MSGKLMYGDNFLRRSTCRGRDHRRRHAVIRRPETTTPALLADTRAGLFNAEGQPWRSSSRPTSRLSSAHPMCGSGPTSENDSRTANATRIEYAIAYAEDYVNNRFRWLLPVRRAACPRLRSHSTQVKNRVRGHRRALPVRLPPADAESDTPDFPMRALDRVESPDGRGDRGHPGDRLRAKGERAGGLPGDRSMSSIRITTKIATPTINRLQAALANPSGSEASGRCRTSKCGCRPSPRRFNINSRGGGDGHRSRRARSTSGGLERAPPSARLGLPQTSGSLAPPALAGRASS